MAQKRKKLRRPATIEIYTAPWVQGRYTHYMGPISTMAFIHGTDQQDWSDGEIKTLEALAKIARSMQANAILGIEIVMDPFAMEHGKRGLRISMAGTAARVDNW